VKSNASADDVYSKHDVVNTSSSASAGTKKVEDDLPDGGCAYKLYTSILVEPRVKGTQMEAVKYLTDCVQSIVEEGPC
jgi:hypothetical protein